MAMRSWQPHRPRASTPSLVRDWLMHLQALGLSSTWRTRLRSRTRQFWSSSRRQGVTSLPRKRPLAWDITLRFRSSAPIAYADNSIGAMEQRAQEGLKALAEDEGWDFGDYSAEKHTLDAEGALEPQSAPWTKGRKRDSSHDDKQR